MRDSLIFFERVTIMQKISLFAAILLSCVVSVSAQGDKAAVYNDLLSKVKGGDMTVDFKALRFAFAEKGPAPFDPKVQGGMTKALNDKNYKEAARLADAIQKANFVDMNSHVVAAMAHGALGDAKKAKFHEAVYLGLINSIINGSDGNSTKTAYVVVSLLEVPVVLNALDLKRTSQEMIEEGGHKYGVIVATDKNTAETTKVYFNVDLAAKGMSPLPAKK